MSLVIISVILTVLTVIAILCGEENKMWCLTGFIWLVLILFGCFTNVKANHIGIIYNPFKGGVQNEVLGEGFKKKTPFDKVYKISTQVQEFEFKDISVQTNDSQYVNTKLQVQVRIDKEKAFEYFKKYGGKNLNNIQSILSNTTQKQLEKVTTKYNIMEVLGEKRNQIVDETLIEVKNELINDGILIERIVLIDTDAGEKIENAIQQEASAKKEAETAKYLKEKAELEGEAKVIEAQKEKEANALKQKSLTNEILTEKMIEKWNGTLPTTMLGEDVLSTFNVNK